MPQEPDRKIEELLKAYTKKRRDDAGAPLELHPATRKLLQGEVARLRPKSASHRKSWFPLLIQSWPRFAFAVSIVIALGVLIWVFNPPNRKFAEFAQAAREPMPESLRDDYAREKDVSLTREAAEKLSASERNDKPEPDLEKSVQESRTVSLGDAVVASDEIRGAESDYSKRADVQRKLKQAPEAKSNLQLAPTAPLPERPLSSTMPLASTPPTLPQRQKDSTDTSALANQPGEVARGPLGGLRSTAGGVGGGKAQERLGAVLGAEANSILEQTRATPAPSQPTTNTTLAFSITDLPTADGVQSYNFRDGSGSSNALFGNVARYYAVLQPQVLGGYSTNVALFADGRANAPTLNFQQRSWEESSNPANKKVPELRSPNTSDIVLTKSDQQSETAKGTSTALSADRDLDRLARRSQTANDPAGATWKFVAEELPAQAGKPVVLNEAAASAEKVADKPGADSPSPTSSRVLNSFQVNLNGDRVRLIDADGSEYEGQLSAGGEAWSREMLETKKEAEALRLADGEKKQRVAGAPTTASGASTQPQPYAFRVSGTNRSLNQLVVLDAVLSAPTGSRAEAAASSAVARFRGIDALSAAVGSASATSSPAPAAPRSSVLMQNSQAGRAVTRSAASTPALRIQGKARIGSTNVISINAIGIAP